MDEREQREVNVAGSKMYVGPNSPVHGLLDERKTGFCLFLIEDKEERMS